ncbi:protein of unknown function [Nitrospira japonica]|uniref:Uncharacterized protein n=1 Tax=Nitrospira japonica TaxID=1325564 RepID=A0A1W1I0B2_9BACT|nr:protein of unknown function [Nitrospira japonica]
MTLFRMQWYRPVSFVRHFLHSTPGGMVDDQAVFVGSGTHACAAGSTSGYGEADDSSPGT